MGDTGPGLTNPTSITVPRRMWSDAEWDGLRRGPADDEWVASLEGARLTLSQSTTGRSIYEALFRRELVGWKITSAEVESDPEIYQPGNAQQESARLQSLIERLLR